MAHKVEVLPLQLVLDVDDGETVMAAAERVGVRWPTVCHGDGSCSVCWFEVVTGGDCLGPISPDEGRTLRDLPLHRLRGMDVRLACQAVVRGDVVVRKRGVTGG